MLSYLVPPFLDNSRFLVYHMLKTYRLAIAVNLDQLPYFIAIASYGSLSAASRQLNISQQALSSYLSELARDIGMPLFFRNRQRLHLTEAGRIYINSAQNVLHLESELEADLRAMLAEKKNTLRVFVDFPYISQLSDRILPGFQKKYPDVQVRFLYGSTDEILATLAAEWPYPAL